MTTLSLDHVPAPVRALAQRIRGAKGSSNLVGGGVIDLSQGREVKDWDLEVFGLGYKNLEDLFADLNPQTVGKEFGIIKLRIEGLEVDVSVPRTTNLVGVNDAEFFDADPDMTVEEAARRRDFTINAMAFDMETGELHDPFGGMADLEAGILRATDPEQFVKDPLRAFRAMQLLARKMSSVDPETMVLIKGMLFEFPNIARERVYVEFRKLLLLAPKPSVGLEFLRESGWLVWFPELNGLVGCAQNPEWHPEGDVWVHSLLVVDAMAEVLHMIPGEQQEAFAFAALLHDVGKPLVTLFPGMVDPFVAQVQDLQAKMELDGVDDRLLGVLVDAMGSAQKLRLTAHGHDTLGAEPARSFMKRLTLDKKLNALTVGLVEVHMQPYSLHQGGAGKGAYARLARKIEEVGGDLFLLARMSQCDGAASGPDWETRNLKKGKPNWNHESSRSTLEWAEVFKADASAVEPKVQGRDLTQAGMRPGPQFGKMLAEALEIQYAHPEMTKEDIIAMLP
jgi:tRNA nucleotidyltransferase (CCA-adding enzyme)